MTLADCAAIVTAAGFSSRMGSLKALLDWQGKPLLLHQLERLKGFGQLIVVTGHEAARLRTLIPSIPPAREVFNPDYPTGRTGSLLAGFRALAPARAILVAAVDQPIEDGLPEALVQALEEHPYAFPVHDGRRGHPLVFRGDLLPELCTISEETEGLRGISRKYRAEAVAVPWASPSIFADLNTPADQEAFR
ncbi:MAG: nucleotidyltransferase family protein [Bacteroidota bacterium]